MAPRKPVGAPEVPIKLGTRGQELFDLLAPESADASQKAIALEAARMADRLDALDGVIAGKGVVELMHFRVRHAVNEEGVVTVDLVIDAALSEARQLATAFERVLRAARAGVDVKSTRSGGGSVADELRERRERGERGKRPSSSPAAARGNKTSGS